MSSSFLIIRDTLHLTLCLWVAPEPVISTQWNISHCWWSRVSIWDNSSDHSHRYSRYSQLHTFYAISLHSATRATAKICGLIVKKSQNLSSSVVDYLWWWSRIDELKENIFAKQWMKSVICWSELQLVSTLCWTVLARRITWRKRSWSWCKIWHMPHSPAVTTGQTLCWGVILTMIHNTQPELSWAGHFTTSLLHATRSMWTNIWMKDTNKVNRL